MRLRERLDDIVWMIEMGAIGCALTVMFITLLKHVIPLMGGGLNA